MTPEQYILQREPIQNIIHHSQLLIELLEKKARECPLPDNLRPATPEDLKVGAVIWCKDCDDVPFWQIVDEVLYPSGCKAYAAKDGCRYGLDDAWVEVKP